MLDALLGKKDGHADARAEGVALASSRKRHWIGIVVNRNMEKPQLDESRANDYIGKIILLGVTYVDYEEKEKVLGRRQWVGTILTFNNREGIKVWLSNSQHPCCLPPDPRGIEKAKAGVYKLRSTGEEIVNPDYILACVSTRPGINENSDFLPPGA